MPCASDGGGLVIKPNPFPFVHALNMIKYKQKIDCVFLISFQESRKKRHYLLNSSLYKIWAAKRANKNIYQNISLETN